MSHLHPFTFDFFSGALSVFDIEPMILKKDSSLTKGIGYDMQQLSNDQFTLINDYKKACDRILREHSGENFVE